MVDPNKVSQHIVEEMYYELDKAKWNNQYRTTYGIKVKAIKERICNNRDVITSISTLKWNLKGHVSYNAGITDG